MIARLDRDRSTARLLGQIVTAAAEARAYLEDADASERGLAWSAPNGRQHAERVMAELALLVARLDGVYGSAPVRVVAADAVADSPTDEPSDQTLLIEQFKEELGRSAFNHMRDLFRRSRTPGGAA